VFCDQVLVTLVHLPTQLGQLVDPIAIKVDPGDLAVLGPECQDRLAVQPHPGQAGDKDVPVPAFPHHPPARPDRGRRRPDRR
jgi:hypothetical protein